MGKKYLHLFFAIFIGFGLLYFALKDVDLESFIKSYTAINWLYVSISIFLIFLSSLIRSICWSCLIKVPFIDNYKNIFKAIVIGNMGNSIMPFRSGEFLKMYALSKMVGKSKSYYFALTVIERSLDFMFLILFLGLGCFILKIPIHLKHSLFVIIFLVFSCFVCFFVFLNNQKLYFRLLSWLKLFLNERIYQIINNIFDQFSIAVKTINSGKTITIALISIFFSWLSIAVAYAFALKAFNLSFSFNIAVFLMLVLNIGILLPALPASLGIYQAGTILVFSQYGITKSVALGYSFFLQALEIIPMSILGLIFFFNRGVFNMKNSK